jgi:hypothetical protein
MPYSYFLFQKESIQYSNLSLANSPVETAPMVQETSAFAALS